MNAPEPLVSRPLAIPEVADVPVPGQRPYGAIGFGLGAPMLVLAIVGATVAWHDGLVLLFAIIGAIAIGWGLNLASRQETRRDALARERYRSLPVAILARATTDPALSERTRIAIANYLAGHGAALGEQIGELIDESDSEWQALKSAGAPRACARSCCGPSPMGDR